MKIFRLRILPKSPDPTGFGSATLAVAIKTCMRKLCFVSGIGSYQHFYQVLIVGSLSNLLNVYRTVLWFVAQEVFFIHFYYWRLWKWCNFQIVLYGFVTNKKNSKKISNKRSSEHSWDNPVKCQFPIKKSLSPSVNYTFWSKKFTGYISYVFGGKSMTKFSRDENVFGQIKLVPTVFGEER